MQNANIQKYSKFLYSKALMNQEVNKGLEALEIVINQQKDVFDAFSRKDIGSISLIYGFAGRLEEENSYKLYKK